MRNESDFLVIGGGIAGLWLALKAAQVGKVTILTKKGSRESSSNLAQGGIAAVSSKEDSFEEHVRDTLVAGAGLCHEDTVRTVITEGPSRIDRLVKQSLDELADMSYLAGGVELLKTVAGILGRRDR